MNPLVQDVNPLLKSMGAYTGAGCDKLQRELEEMFISMASSANLGNIFHMPVNSPELQIPILLTIIVAENGTKTIAGPTMFVFAHLLEKGMPSLDPIRVGRGYQQEQTASRFCADMWTVPFTESLQNYIAVSPLASTYGVGVNNIIVSGYAVFPTTVTTTDTTAVAQYFHTGLNVLLRGIDIACERPMIDYTAKQLADYKGASLEAEVIHYRQPDDQAVGSVMKVDFAGRPVAAHFEVKTVYRTKNDSQIATSGEIVVANASVIVDFAQASNTATILQDNTRVTPPFMPVFIFTGFGTVGAGRTVNASPLTCALATAAASALMDPRTKRYLSVWAQTIREGKCNLGMLSTVANPLAGSGIDVQRNRTNLFLGYGGEANNDNAMSLDLFARLFIQPEECVVAIDSAAGAPDAMFVDILTTDHALMLHELNVFTDNKFGAKWAAINNNNENAPFTLGSVVIPAGTYTVGSTVVDIRSMTLTEILARGEADTQQLPEIMMLYLQLFNPEIPYSDDLYIAKIRFLQTLFPTFQHTGMITRYYMDPRMLTVFASCLTDVNLSIQLNTTDAAATGVNVGWGQNISGSMNTGGMFASGRSGSGGAFTAFFNGGGLGGSTRGMY
jgi:hypothetical protein